MIDKEKIEFIIKHQRFPKGFFEYFNYGILIFPISFIVVGLLMIYNVITYRNNDFIFIGTCCLILGIPFLRFTWIRLNDNLRFVYLRTDLMQADNIRVSIDVLKDYLNLELVEKVEKHGLVHGQTNISPFSWGENITIICLDKYVLINSKPNQPATIYKDRLNIKRIKRGFEKRINNNK